ncbi:MAG: hypothetical protein H8E62_06475, partial [Planctomycetes bacterium]|nr:hypothetical protein [Planctomycetota bacterium]
KKLATINQNDYEITTNSQGRKDNAIVVPITQSEVLLSQVVAQKIAETIIEASNKGPQFIIVQIDSPGGRADYMKIISSAITQTKNCPVIAYIDGQRYGGAFSTAALIALACEKVYIAPTASMGAVGPITEFALTDEDYASYLSLYSPYTFEHNSIAEYRHRPKILTEALVNRKISVVEVTNLDGSRDFVKKDERQPTQTVVRTLAEGLDSTPDETASPADVIRSTLHLTALNAVEVGLADKVLDSLADTLSEMNVPQAHLTKASGIDNVIKKYSAARRNISEALSRIDWLEGQASLLEEQFREIENRLKTGTVTREVKRGRTSLPNNYDVYYFEPSTVTDGVVVQGGRGSSRYNRSRSEGTETIITEFPATDLETIQQELLGVLGDLIAEYRRVMTLAKRWPGGLPPEIPHQMLMQNSTSAIAFRDYLLDLPDYYFDQQSPSDYYEDQDRDRRYRR